MLLLLLENFVSGTVKGAEKILPNGMFSGHISTTTKDPSSAKNANLQLQVCQNSASICEQHSTLSGVGRAETLGWPPRRFTLKNVNMGLKL